VRFQGIAEQVNIIHRGFIFKSVVTFHETLFLSPLSTFVLYLGLIVLISPLLPCSLVA
jgi:hypothetical protein